MFFRFKYHLNIFLIIILTILISCKLQEPSKNHGIIFLKNRSDKLIINKTNKNDVINIIGQPHTKSINNDDEWIYFERILTKGKFHKLGKNIVKSNNILILEFNKYGVLDRKHLFNKEDINKVAFSSEVTKNETSQRSFVQKFLQSLKSKMYNRSK
jgi:outer membrane protein assembly factor BamE (lipoprotein component of BamABCDE complex)